MMLSDFLSRIKEGKSNHHEIILILFDFQKVLQEKNYIHSRSGAQIVGITVEKYMVMINFYFLI